ncbi:MAG: ATP-binding protein [Clostridia bacterium]|nr:ATP-binding protein [Clostridia bacterium]
MKREIYNKLIEWKNNNINMPFMLVGARQTGKTYILNEFCNNEFEKNLYINLDKSEDIREIFEETLEPDTIIQNIEALKNISIDINNTIVFLDEIQVSERAISSLKYFCESEKPYKIVCAGSLLGVKINRFKSSFPVGKVWIDYLYPMKFNEFLLAIGEEKLLDLIENGYKDMEPIIEVNHKKALKLYYDYICIGGMPASILQYIENGKSIANIDDDLLRIIITSYLADMAKYTENTESIKNTKIYNSIPSQLGKENKKFKYSLVEKSARSREYDSSLNWLLSSNMILKCDGVENPKSPLKANKVDNFKIYLSDMGLLRVLANIDKTEILLNKNMIYKGAITENYVAQVLYAKHHELFYWQQGNQYEVDFLINMEGDIIPIEVKAGDNTTSRSLNHYISKYKPKYSIRVSTKNFGFSNNIKSVPLYAVHLI